MKPFAIVYMAVLANIAYAAVLGKRNLISTSARNSVSNAGIGSSNVITTIQTNTQYWLSGAGPHNLFGNIDNSGTLIISQTDNKLANYGGQTSDWSGTDANNGNLINYAEASIQLNDVSAASASTYEWYLNSFVNNGTIQWAGRGDTSGSTFQLYCKETCTNNGLIDFEQVKGNLGTAAVWRNNVLSPGTSSCEIYNNGGFLMRSLRVDFVQNFMGTGCWMIGNDAIMYLQDGVGIYQNQGYGAALEGQSISFLDQTGVLHLDTQVYSRNSKFGATIYGFGTGNAIEFLETIKSFSYASGLLTVKLISGNSVQLNIGSGYDSSGFSKATQKNAYGSFNAINYRSSAPAVTTPAQCLLTVSACSALDDLPTTSTYQQTSSAIAISSSLLPASTAKATYGSSSETSVLYSTKPVFYVSTMSSTGLVGSTSADSAMRGTSTRISTTALTSSQARPTSSSSFTTPIFVLSISASTGNVASSVDERFMSTSSTSAAPSSSQIYSASVSNPLDTFAASTASASTSVTTSASAIAISASPSVTSTSNFYLKSSCDTSCIGNYADDHQLYTNLYTSTAEDFNAFYLDGSTLYDASTDTLCVASQAAGTATQLQCSNDLDWIDGVPIVGGWGSTATQLLTYQGNSTFYGCGVLDLADNYEPNGLTYSTVLGDPSNCRACSFTLVASTAQCTD